jgi:hypothetical protein
MTMNWSSIAEELITLKVSEAVNYKETAVVWIIKKRDRNSVNLPYVKPADTFTLI